MYIVPPRELAGQTTMAKYRSFKELSADPVIDEVVVVKVTQAQGRRRCSRLRRLL
jgi:hypothetical protein